MSVVTRPSATTFLRENAALAFLGAAHLPFLVVYLAQLWRYEHYQFYPFAVAAFIGLYWTRIDREKIRISWSGQIAIAIDLILLPAAIVINYSPFAAAGFVLYIFAVTLGSQESDKSRSMTYLTLLPLILLRPPRRLDQVMIHWLQEQTTWLASRGVENLGYLHLRQGNVIKFPGKDFLVEEACSGVQSLFTVLFLAVVIVCWFRRKLIHSILLISLGLLFAATMNVLRISALAVAWQDLDLDLSTGWQHDVLGYIALAVAVTLLVSADALLSFFFSPFKDTKYGQLAATYRNPFTALWNFVFGGQTVRRREKRSITIGKVPGRRATTCLSVFALVTLSLQGVMLYASGADLFKLPQSDLGRFEESILPHELEGFVASGYATRARDVRSNWGEFSNIWQMTSDELTAIISCDHPFLNWHFLNICYNGIGWDVGPSRVLLPESEWPFLMFQMHDPDSNRHGTVIYTHFYADGSQLVPPATEFSLRYIVQRMRSLGRGGMMSLLKSPQDSASYQIQMYVESAYPLSDDQMDSLTTLFTAARERLYSHYSARTADEIARPERIGESGAAE